MDAPYPSVDYSVLDPVSSGANRDEEGYALESFEVYYVLI